MDHPGIYNFFKRKLGHDIADILYDMTYGIIKIDHDKKLVTSQNYHCPRASMMYAKCVIDIVEFEKDSQMEATIIVKPRIYGQMCVSRRTLNWKDMELGYQVSNEFSAIVSAGFCKVSVYVRIVSAGKVVLNFNHCRLNINHVSI